ncbi:hypothetical protein AAG593_04885 [Citromicrobium bathyomarinum]
MNVSFGSTSDAQFEIWTALGPASALVVALIGWWVVEKFARARERRSDLRALIKILDDSIERIVEQSLDFYSIAGNDPRAPLIANSLKAKLATLATHLNTIRTGGIDIQTDFEMKAFRQAVTGGAFESSLRPVIAGDSVKFQTIVMAAEDLRLKVKAEFFRKIAGHR